MNIELSEKEFRDLLDILHIADIVLSGHRREPDKRSERHRALIQKLYGRAKGEGGLDQLMTLNVDQVHVPTPEFEEHSLAHAAIDEFGDHLFWDELIARLSVRDAAREVGGLDRLNALSDSDRQAAEAPIRQRYIEEFSRNGLADLALIEGFAGARREPVRTSD